MEFRERDHYHGRDDGVVCSEADRRTCRRQRDARRSRQCLSKGEYTTRPKRTTVADTIRSGMQRHPGNSTPIRYPVSGSHEHSTRPPGTSRALVHDLGIPHGI